MESKAIISDDGLYRYALMRSWGDGPSMTFIMLNPSTADASIDDPTIRRCIGFAKREGCGGLTVVNLFALRATNPKKLLNCEFPRGEDNPAAVGEAIIMAAESRGIVVAAWGAWWDTNSHRMLVPTRITVEQRALNAGVQLKCLGVTKTGQPRHPLYVKADQPLVDYPAVVWGGR